MLKETFFITYTDGSTESIPFNGGGDNDVATFTIQRTDVEQIDINLIGSGGISHFEICAAQSLPVEYISFDVNKHQDGAILEWSTATEINSEKFEVLKSYDGKIYNKIGEVKAATNSNVETQYTFIDNEARGKAYYRLNQVDLDGRSELSPIRSIELELEGEVNIYPNPATDNLFVQLGGNADGSTIKIISMTTGELIRQEVSRNAVEEINTANIPQGFYLLEIMNSENNKRTINKFYKL